MNTLRVIGITALAGAVLLGLSGARPETDAVRDYPRDLLSLMPTSTLFFIELRPRLMSDALKKEFELESLLANLIGTSSEGVESLVLTFTSFDCVNAETNDLSDLAGCGLAAILEGDISLSERLQVYDRYGGHDVLQGGVNSDEYLVRLTDRLLIAGPSPEALFSLVDVNQGREASLREGGARSFRKLVTLMSPRAALSIVAATPEPLLDAFSMVRNIARFGSVTVGFSWFAHVSVTLDGSVLSSVGDVLGLVVNGRVLGNRAHVNFNLLCSDAQTARMEASAFRLLGSLGGNLVKTTGQAGLDQYLARGGQVRVYDEVVVIDQAFRL